ncbi:MAG: hypothetical protein KAS32_03060 [Candidatus Peribacteraceae bacterium]|nr:hypothetical protein [Candidatus Peribacteraceae bacterium]
MTKQLTKEQFGMTSEKMFNFALCMFTIGSETYGNGLRSAEKAQYKGDSNQLGQRAHELVNNRKVIKLKTAITGKVVKKYELKAHAVIDRLCKLSGLSPSMDDDKLPPTSEQGQLRSLELLGKNLDLWSDTGQAQAVSITIAAPEPSITSVERPLIEGEINEV